MAGSREQNVDIKSSLRDWFSGAERVAVAGIGNPFRRDDFVGVEIVRNLQNKVSESVYLIEAETIPETYRENIMSVTNQKNNFLNPAKNHVNSFIGS